jgi:hypothetical protein
MFFNPDADPEEFSDDEMEAPLNEPEPIYSQAGLDPLDELAFHVDDAMQAKAMLAEADALATQRPALQERYIASLTEAGNKVSAALYLARQQDGSPSLPTADRRAEAFVDRLDADRADISLA